MVCIYFQYSIKIHTSVITFFKSLWNHSGIQWIDFENHFFPGLPRPSPPKNSLSSKSKLTSARSLENVPITVNSHIPALGGPLRPSSVASKKVTSEMGTQCMEQAEKNQVTKSVSVENLTSPTRKSRSSDCLLLQSQSKKAHSESSDPICGSQVKKWSYTNGRTSLLINSRRLS